MKNHNSTVLTEYYRILEIDSKANLVDIKKAYRKRAKDLHPDVNQSPDAQEKFVLLNEAYEYLQNKKTGKVYSHREHNYTKPKTKYKSRQDWENKEKERARRRAQHHAKMRYEAFTQTDFYKTTVALDVLMDFVSLLSVGFIFIGIPIIAYSTVGTTGLYIAAFLIFITVGYWASVLLHILPNFSFRELGNSIKQILNTRAFQITALVILNIYFAAEYGLSTLLPIWVILFSYALPVILFYFLFKTAKHHNLLTWGIAPAIVSIFFLMNFYFSSNPTTETYRFKNRMESRGYRSHGKQKTSFIILNGNKYDEYPGIRVFFDFSKMEKSHSITYRFADGFFGLRVMEDYQFH
ncbi:J domain-containing protein [Owenweeksia hongkongensis]|uniref:J domain-containing protein n=1 Tax=Owenweeksia hongkongensis TaxID=253245 RepID=UPI003A8F69CA